MYKWEVYFKDTLNGIKKHFIVKSNDKGEAIQKACEKCNNRNLNNYDIQLQIF